MLLSIVIPAYNEEKNIAVTLQGLLKTLQAEEIDCELIVANDSSDDGTADVVREFMADEPSVRLVDRRLPRGFGRAIRDGLEAVTGDVVVIYMADQSDDPDDVVAYYRKIQEGYDCVFGSRFIKGSEVQNYPKVKLFCNRVVNHVMKWMFWTRFNDLTNAFKAYRTHVIRECGPYRGCHFNITIEMSLSALIRRYNIAEMPIKWQGRTWGSSNLRLRQMGRRYLETLLMLFFQKLLISDDLLAERMAAHSAREEQLLAVAARVDRLEREVDSLRQPKALATAVSREGQS